MNVSLIAYVGVGPASGGFASAAPVSARPVSPERASETAASLEPVSGVLASVHTPVSCLLPESVGVLPRCAARLGAVDSQAYTDGGA